MLKLEEKDKEILKEIKRVIMKVAKEMNIEIDKIILFGSRARGEYREDSDWDILVVTRKEMTRSRDIKFRAKILVNLAEKGIDADILTISKLKLAKLKDDRGYVYYYARKEGVII